MGTLVLDDEDAAILEPGHKVRIEVIPRRRKAEAPLMSGWDVADPGLDFVESVDLLGAGILLTVALQVVDDREEVLGEAIGGSGLCPWIGTAVLREGEVGFPDEIAIKLGEAKKRLES